MMIKHSHLSTAGTFHVFIYLLHCTIQITAVSICDIDSISGVREGEVTSPGYPLDYDPGSCRSDRLEIDSSARFCGYYLPTKYTSRDSRVRLVFVSDRYNIFDERGFALRFRVIRALGEGICPSRVIKNRLSGSLYSPQFPRDYSDGRGCRVTVRVPDNYMMHVWFTSFHLEKSPTCEYDWLTVKDEHGGWKMCGGGVNKIPRPMRLTGRTVNLAFKSNQRKTEKGFHMHFNISRLSEGSCVCTRGLGRVMVKHFKSKIMRAQNTVEFSFRTGKAFGLIMFSQGRLRDHIYIGLRYGQVFYQTDLGTGRGLIISRGPRLHDNKWHNVLISRTDRTIALSVDGRLEGSSSTRGSFTRLDIPDAVGLFLGAPSTISGIVGNFRGCIRDLRIDGREPITNAFAQKPDYDVIRRIGFFACKS
ncbi:uncharacterized protein LOC5505354 isoform X2 [Nematostella vectensis]|uniref:uncharacterized protein LOC5505354 isoform X2 n=1 Tax=Nematostella vectensis TaxID=45351 RepID=UPI001390631A|nr:uncharacterized protein LOC5505354 isoform X2 [Nematostella vectensis]